MLLKILRTIVTHIAPRLPLLLFFLGAGVVCSVVVAWAGCVLEESSPIFARAEPAPELRWPGSFGQVLAHPRAGRTCDWLDIYLGVDAPESRSFRTLPALWIDSIRPREFDGVAVRAGWPFRSLCACIPDPKLEPGDPRQTLLEAPAVVGAWWVRWFGGEFRILPRRVMWSGSVGNVLFYAVVLRLLVAGPPRLRRAIRRERGLCPWCAYPRGTSPVCTECGTPLV